MARLNSSTFILYLGILLFCLHSKTMATQYGFGKDLYKILATEVEGKLFFSPFSVRTAMSMVHLGSSGNSEKQGQEVLHLPEGKEDIKQQFQKLLSGLKDTNGSYELDVSNSAYVSNQLDVRQSFIESLTKYFNSSAETVNFGQSEAVRSRINSKVEKDTRSKIKDLIPSGALTERTRMVIVNAIYFKGLWDKPFETEKTENKPFWIDSETSKEVPMMHAYEEFKLGAVQGSNARALAFPYKGDNMHFVVLLPNKRDGLADLESKLHSVDFGELLKKHMFKQKVQVALPKFKLELSLELADYFKKMGMTDLFDVKKADLSEMSPAGGLFVSEVFHKSFLEVNEEGSEAAAATGAVMMVRSMLPRKIDPFIADHPFIFLIFDNNSNEVLFMGRYCVPDDV